MEARQLARDVLWDLAAGQHGYLTAAQALDQGVTRKALNQLVHRGTLERAAFGVYRFPRYPVTAADPYMLAVLWTRAEEAALSHETALDVFAVCDVNPDVIHITISRRRRLRRAEEERYVVHREDLDPAQLAWWEEVPVVTLATAIRQCIDTGTPAYLLEQAIANGHTQGRLTTVERAELADRLRADRR